MAHAAEVVDGRVTRVIVVADRYDDLTGPEWAAQRFGGTWVQCSYNTRAGQHRLGGTPLRKNYPGIGYSYDAARDAFIPPQPFPSWRLNEDTCQWDAPVAMPTDGRDYEWDEARQRWSRP